MSFILSIFILLYIFHYTRISIFYMCVCVSFPTYSFFSLLKATLAPLVRIQENVPQFKLPPLEPGREYQLAVYAVNAKGRSENYIFDRVRVGSLLPPYGKLHLENFQFII